MDLGAVFSLEYERTVSEDWVVRYDNRFLQIETAEVRPGAKVTIRIRRNGRMELLHEGKRLKWYECEERPRKPEPQRRSRTRREVKTDPNHPQRGADPDTPQRVPPPETPGQGDTP